MRYFSDIVGFDTYHRAEYVSVVQSWVLTTAKYDFDIYQKRLLYVLVHMTQHLLSGRKLTDDFRLDRELFDLYHVVIPFQVFLSSEDDKNHSVIDKSLNSLCFKGFTYSDKKCTKAVNLIAFYKHDYHSHFVEFRIHKDVYDAILSFGKGFRTFELTTVMRFNSVYAMRFYELFSNQNATLVFSVDELKSMFKLEKKYKQVNDFVMRVIESAKSVLDKESPYSFDYIPVKQGKRIVAFKFIPVHIKDNVSDTSMAYTESCLRRRLSVAWTVRRDVIDYLKNTFSFSTKEIKNNETLIASVDKEHPDLLLFLANLKLSAFAATNSKGYVINALKNVLKSNSACN